MSQQGCTGGREKVRVLVRDAARAKAAYGPYVIPVAGDSEDASAVAAALRGARSAVVAGRLGALLPAAQQVGLEHLVSGRDGIARKRRYALVNAASVRRAVCVLVLDQNVSKHLASGKSYYAEEARSCN